MRWILGLVLAVVLGSLPAGAQDFFGVWDVDTYLTAASNPVNRDYRPGDVRAEVWRIEGAGGQASLTSSQGTMPGRIAGGQAQFYAEAPLGQVLVMRILIEAALSSSRSMKGTIRAEYWDARFGTQVGLDAWTFEALRR